MFWQIKPTEESAIDALLSAEHVNLRELLDDPYVLQEVRNSNEKLLNYVTREDVLIEMMNSVLRPAIDSSLPLQRQYRYSHLCCELLSLNSDEIGDAVMSSEPVLAVISEFMDERCAVNHLVASFYMKIVCQLLSKHPEKMLEVLDSGRFVERCLENLQFSAVSELVFRLVSISYDNTIAQKIRQWYVDNGLLEGSISLLDPSFPSAAHDNVGYLWTELVKILRDVLYSSEEKYDPLLEKMQTRETIEQLIGKLLKLGTCDGVCESVVSNVCQILITLIETNFVPHCPSHQLSVERTNWVSILAENSNELDGHEVWQPDSLRVVETVVVENAGHLLRLVIDELQIDERGDSWLSVLQLLVQLCDTMYLPTHETLYNAFKEHDLSRLFDLATVNPGLSVLHKLLQKLVLYVLCTISSEESPLLGYFFKEMNLVTLLCRNIDPICTLPLLSLVNIRSFYANLADQLISVAEEGPNKDRTKPYLKDNAEWESLVSKVSKYAEWNKTDLSDNSNSARDSDKAEDFFGSASNMQILQSVMSEFESSTPTQLLPDVFDASISSKLGSADATGFRVITDSKHHITTEVQSVEIDESEFEKLCSLRSTSDILGPKSSSSNSVDPFEESAAMFSSVPNNDNDWPGNVSSTSNGEEKAIFDDWPADASNSIRLKLPVKWDNLEGTSTSQGDDWPTSLQSASSSKEVAGEHEEEDLFANFSSHKKGLSPWPASQDENAAEEWPSSGSENEKCDPVMEGLACGVIHPEIGSSEC